MNAHADWAAKNIGREFDQNRALFDRWYSNLPKKTRDREESYNEGTFGSELERATNSHEKYSELEEAFYINHRQLYPIMSEGAADEKFQRDLMKALRCIASDDPRLAK